ncbi:MAG: UDP-N-acetylglucosamine 2-epimerase (non-hydrolyzing) [Cyanobacteriota bacterium]
MSEKLKVLLVFGTRPEAIKMAPVYLELSKRDCIIPEVCVTAQHREMLDQVLELFKISPDYDLDIMQHNQDLWTLTSNVLYRMKTIIEKSNPHIILVHGDTTTTMATSISAFYSKVPIGHVEAGLRTYDIYYPFPEEINRVVTDCVSSYFFAPTELSVQNLVSMGANKNYIFKTGNTVIDALLYTVNNHKSSLGMINLDKNLKTILITAHRRENFGKPLENVCHALLDIVKNHSDIQVVYPVHLNPNVQEPVKRILGNQERIILTKPLDYAPFASLMAESHIILTDSGGIQEEAPSLGKPVLVLREETERPEAVEHGTVKLIGTNREKIYSLVDKLLTDNSFYSSMAEATNPYGDGLASKRIADILEQNRQNLISKNNIHLKSPLGQEN